MPCAYKHADLSGIIFHLSAGLAHYALTGELTTGRLRRGTALALEDFSVAGAPLPAANCVLIPKDAMMLQNPEVFTALVCATNAAGSKVASDHVRVNPNTNAARLDVFRGADLAHGCLWALRMLFKMCSDADATCIAALAFVKGIHSVASVSHSDEGGYTRDVLRCGKFVAPYGRLFAAGVTSYIGFMTFKKGSPN